MYCHPEGAKRPNGSLGFPQDSGYKNVGEGFHPLPLGLAKAVDIVGQGLAPAVIMVYQFGTNGGGAMWASPPTDCINQLVQTVAGCRVTESTAASGG